MSGVNAVFVPGFVCARPAGHTLLLQRYDGDEVTAANELVPVLRSRLLREPSGRRVRYLLKEPVKQLMDGLQAGAHGTMLR